MGDVTDLKHFLGALIDQAAYQRVTGALGRARAEPGCELVAGGGASDREGHFVAPTIFRVADPAHWLMREELFGPVLAVWVYEDDELERALGCCEEGCAYALTGSIFARGQNILEGLASRLRFAAGNLVVNDKPTAAVVGQQPFGGSRKSGTNDKAGSMLNLWRWVSPRTVKQTFLPPTEVGYPHQQPGS